MNGTAFKNNFAAVDLVHACEHIEHSGFACSIRADQADNLALIDFKADMIHCNQAAESLCDIIYG